MLLSQSWLLISSAALPLERWWEFGVKNLDKHQPQAYSVAVPGVCSLSSVPGPVTVTAGPFRGSRWREGSVHGAGAAPQPCPGHCMPGLKLGAVPMEQTQGELQIKTCISSAEMLNYWKSRRGYRVWIKEMGQTLWRQGWNTEGRTKLCCIIRGFVNGVAERGKGAWLTWCDLKIHRMCYTES